MICSHNRCPAQRLHKLAVTACVRKPPRLGPYTEAPRSADVSDLGTRIEMRFDIATVWFASVVRYKSSC